MKTYTAHAFQLNQAYWPLRHASQASDQRASQASDHKGQSNLKHWLKNLFKTLLYQMEGSAGPQVWSTRDEAGRTLWNAYDGVSGRTIHQASETEMRVWLESRYRF